MKKFQIEERIKPLVDILNEVPYITTTSSCEGHYESKDYEKYRANVVFEVEESHEADFESLATLILAETAPYFPDALVKVLKQYYVLPGENELNTKWEIRISPFSQDATLLEKRRVTDEAIDIIVSVVRDYLNHK